MPETPAGLTKCGAALDSMRLVTRYPATATGARWSLGYDGGRPFRRADGVLILAAPRSLVRIAVVGSAHEAHGIERRPHFVRPAGVSGILRDYFCWKEALEPLPDFFRLKVRSPERFRPGLTRCSP